MLRPPWEVGSWTWQQDKPTQHPCCRTSNQICWPYQTSAILLLEKRTWWYLQGRHPPWKASEGRPAKGAFIGILTLVVGVLYHSNSLYNSSIGSIKWIFHIHSLESFPPSYELKWCLYTCDCHLNASMQTTQHDYPDVLHNILTYHMQFMSSKWCCEVQESIFSAGNICTGVVGVVSVDIEKFLHQCICALMRDHIFGKRGTCFKNRCTYLYSGKKNKCMITWGSISVQPVMGVINWIHYCSKVMLFCNSS